MEKEQVNSKPTDLELSWKDVKEKIVKWNNKINAQNLTPSQLQEKERDELHDLYALGIKLCRKIAENIIDEENPENKKKKEGYLNNISLLEKKIEDYSLFPERHIPTTRLEDVKGLNEVKELITNFLFILENDSIRVNYNLTGGLGVLLYGPPGTGKTMIVEAIANKLQKPLFVITPADIFGSYVGESEKRVKELFEQMDSCPNGSILFIDECESIFAKRGTDDKEYKQAVTTELLQRINGFGTDGSKRVMIAATNMPEKIDKAYLRFKRFGYQILVTLPDREAIRAIIESKLPKIGLEKGFTIDELIEMTLEYGEERYSAADICGIIETACMQAIYYMQNNKLKDPIRLNKDFFLKAFKDYPPKLSVKDIARYTDFKVGDN